MIVASRPEKTFQSISSASPVYIPRGSVFQARLQTTIKTSLQATIVVAETTRAFALDSRRSIPAGSRLIGSAIFDPVTKGVVVTFDTFVSPRGVQHDGVSFLALSANAWPELNGIVFEETTTEMGTALAFGFLGGFSEAAQSREATVLGSVPQPGLRNQLFGGVSAASFKIAEEALEKIRNGAVEYAVVPAGTEIFVLVNAKWNLSEVIR
jgi:hypothetical protein